MMGRRIVSFLCIAVACIAVLSNGALGKKFWGTNEERYQMISDAVAEAKLSVQLQEEAAKSAPMGPLTSSQLLARGFKKPSPEAVKQGKARLLMEDMVHRAEKKLLELKKKQDGSSDNPKVLAEDLAEELFHRPGVLLKKDEIARIFTESGCNASRRTKPRCNQATVNTFRTIDGTCNNLQNPLQGAAQTAFRRLIPASYEDGISKIRGRKQAMMSKSEMKRSLFLQSGPFDPPYPSARLISQKIVRNDSSESATLTHAVMQWGQFLDHDMDLGPEIEEECSGCEDTEVCEQIRVPDNDPVFGNNPSSRQQPSANIDSNKVDRCLPFRRSIVFCTETTRGSFAAREQLNDLTSYIDGSQIYGSSEKVARSLRSFSNGLMKTSSGRNLPTTTHDCLMGASTCFLAGDVRSNEQVGLTSMHTLWVREHNRIAVSLKQLNPSWNDERLYQESRKIVGAMLQKITYSDYLPKVLGYKHLDDLLPRYIRYDSTVDATVPNSFATAAYRYGHSLVRPVFSRFRSDRYQDGTDSPLNLRRSFFNQKAFLETDLGSVFRGLVTQNSLRMDESVNSVLTTQLFQRPNSPGMDLAALNIQRQRDHGMPSYTVWRNFCQNIFRNLPMATIRASLTKLQLLRIYGFLENVDFWLGGISEESIPGGIVGPTFACIFGLTFQNVRDGDRLWYENPGVFTPQQLQELKKASLSRVICDNTAVNVIQRDAFLSNQSRVSCNSLPQINLNPWGEKNCYIRVGHSGGSGQAMLAVYRAKGVYHCSTGKDVLGTKPTCISIECPSSTVRETIRVYPRFWRARRQCKVASVNGKLPSNTARSWQRYLYKGRLFSSSLIDRGSGIYGSLAQCMTGSAVAITYRCNRYGRRDDEGNALYESEGDLEDCNSPSAHNCTLPDDDEEMMGDGMELNLSDTEKHKIVADVQDSDLMKQLEDTLEKLE